MPNYATLAEMLARFPEEELIQLTDDERTGEIVEHRVDTAIGTAETVVNGYVAAFYKRVDLTAPVPAALVDLTCDLARFYLFRHDSPTEQVQNRHDAAIVRLKDIASGKFKLDLGEEVIPEREGAILLEAPEREFSQSKLGGY